jgi:hypothetical protein
MRFWFLAMALAICAQTVLSDAVYETYTNPRFGYAIDYPSDVLYPQGESDNGDGQRFLSKDADASLLVYGANNVLGESLDDRFREDSRGGTEDDPTKVVTFKVAKKNWFVVSGYKSGKIFYQKTISGDDRFNTFYLEYDEDQRGLYDPIAEHISKSFKSLQ